MGRKPKKPKKPKEKSPRFGIGEWYGIPVESLNAERRQQLGHEQSFPKKDRPAHECPFQAAKKGAICSKPGGVCSLKLYEHGEHLAENGKVRMKGVPALGDKGDLRCTCLYRFHEGLEVFKWVGEVILDDPSPEMVGEVGFLEASATTDAEGGDDVGRIDMVLVKSNSPDGHPLQWCAVEIQAVYFSGSAMTGEFKAYSDQSVDWLIYPTANRRPDYRSSGPKRLMPQLQIKVPTLRRWGKKMAVVVDRAFFNSMGQMDHVNDISNADIAWFVVRFEEQKGGPAKLVRDRVQFTTLERSVEGLTGGLPVTLSKFEERIVNKEAKGGAAADQPHEVIAEETASDTSEEATGSE